ncbi:MAG: type IA DNA topoisomerase [Lachnospiraceae bacterium]|nr:type IA DNA topoisomerase [Lachnospiraceae bacterium]
MSKSLFIAEKPSVAQEFAKALHDDFARRDGYLESGRALVSWCVGHLVSMSYPEAYDPELKKWRMETLPFIPETFRYEIIAAVQKQFSIVKTLLNRSDVDRIYVCTDSGREGEYIYRLVEQMAGTHVKDRRRVWIDSQTEAEIQRGIKEAKPLSEYDNLSASAYLRAKEDYLMGINFSRALALKYGYQISDFLGKKTKLAVGRVMTCVLGMVVRREREIRDFVKTPFYRILADFTMEEGQVLTAEWRAVEGSRYFGTPALYKENGFKEESIAKGLMDALEGHFGSVHSISRKKEKNNPPLLFNLAELQNSCARELKISPDETLNIAQTLYEKKLITYPRTDARVLSTAVAKEIKNNIAGLGKIGDVAPFVKEILEKDWEKGIAKSKYTNDKMITDHYAIIPTGQGLAALAGLKAEARAVYEMIVRRFLAIFYPPAVFEKTSLDIQIETEHFFATYKTLLEEGYLQVSGKKKEEKAEKTKDEDKEDRNGEESSEDQDGEALGAVLAALKKGQVLPAPGLRLKAGETSPPKRYSSGTMILAMENAGQLIEDENLRAQIKGSGIGTSATRAEILKKLVSNEYLKLNKKTQQITPTQLGEMIYDTVNASIRSLLSPELTASWELGLSRVAEGNVTEEEYMAKLRDFVIRRVEKVKESNARSYLNDCYKRTAAIYKK